MKNYEIDPSQYEIRDLNSYKDYEECCALQNEIWGEDYVGLTTPVLQWAAQTVGGVCAGAFDINGDMVGFVMGLTGVRSQEIVHWSHMIAVKIPYRRSGIALQLKLYQADKVLSLGTTCMMSSLDPLNAAQANLLGKLGATIALYKRDFYPTSKSPLHRSIGTDRVISAWRLPLFDVPILRIVEHVDITPEWLSVPAVNWPLSRPTQTNFPQSYPMVRICVPADINALQLNDPVSAVEWRHNTRQAFETYLKIGYRGVAFHLHPPIGSYLLANQHSIYGNYQEPLIVDI